MLENHGNITRAFVAFDKRGDGFVTLDELKRVLFNFAFPMSDKLFIELMDRYHHKIVNIIIKIVVVHIENLNILTNKLKFDFVPYES